MGMIPRVVHNQPDEVVGTDGLVLKKETGTLPFRVVRVKPDGWPKEQMVRRFPTRKLASAFLGAMRGNKEAAQRWYREAGARHLKQTGIYRTPQEAWKSAAEDAALIGWSLFYVGADPDTGFPLEQKAESESDKAEQGVTRMVEQEKTESMRGLLRQLEEGGEAVAFGWYKPAEVYQALVDAYLKVHSLKADFDRMEEIPQSLMPAYNAVMKAADAIMQAQKASNGLSDHMRAAYKKFQR